MTTATKTPLDKMLAAFPEATGPHGDGRWYTNPDNPRFDFREREDGSIQITPWTGRTVEDILSLGGLTWADLHTGKKTSPYTHPTLDLFQLAYARRIPWDVLYSMGLSDGYKHDGRRVVKVGYFLPDGSDHSKIRVRKALEGRWKYRWDEGTAGEPIPYGLHKLETAYEQGHLTIGEGESDAWAMWFHGLPYLGLPGTGMAQKLVPYADLLRDLPCIYILHELDQSKKLKETGEGFYKSVRRVLRRDCGYTGEIRCIECKKATGYKDPSDLHIALWDKDIAAGIAPTHCARGFREVIAKAQESAIDSGDPKQAENIYEALAQQDREAALGMAKQLAAMDALELAHVKMRIKETFPNFPLHQFEEVIRHEKDLLEREKSAQFEVKSLRSIVCMN